MNGVLHQGPSGGHCNEYRRVHAPDGGKWDPPCEDRKHRHRGHVAVTEHERDKSDPRLRTAAASTARRRPIRAAPFRVRPLRPRVPVALKAERNERENSPTAPARSRPDLSNAIDTEVARPEREAHHEHVERADGRPGDLLTISGRLWRSVERQDRSRSSGLTKLDATDNETRMTARRGARLAVSRIGTRLSVARIDDEKEGPDQHETRDAKFPTATPASRRPRAPSSGG